MVSSRTTTQSIQCVSTDIVCPLHLPIVLSVSIPSGNLMYLKLIDVVLFNLLFPSMMETQLEESDMTTLQLTPSK